jgi:hypothetical protein
MNPTNTALPDVAVPAAADGSPLIAVSASDAVARRRLLAAAYIAALVPALIAALGQPVWSRVDEAQHYDLVAQYAHGVYPVEGVTRIRPETLAVMHATGVFRWDSAGAAPPPTSSDGVIDVPPVGIKPEARQLWLRRHVWEFSYEAPQPPLYYLAMVPPFVAAKSVGGPMAAVYGLRVVNAVIAAMLSPLTIVLCLKVLPRRLDIALSAGLLAAVWPAFVLNTTQVTNDTAAAILATATLVFAAQGVVSGWTGRRALYAGGTFGAALAVKMTALGLAPALGLALVWPAFRQKQSIVTSLFRLGTAAAAAAPLVLAWFVVNWHVYGSLMPSGDSLAWLPPIRHISPAFLEFTAFNFFVTAWGGDPIFVLPDWPGIAVAGLALVAFAIAGWLHVRGRSLREGISRVAAAIAAFAVAGGLVAAFTIAAARYLATGRYFFPAVASSAVLVAIGLHYALPSRARWLLIAGFATLAAAGIVVIAVVPPPRSGPGAPPADVAVRTALGSARVGDLKLSVDGIASDPTARASWIHVVVDNESSLPAEWSPTPALYLADGRGVDADYRASTHFPETLAPGAHLYGWLRFDLTAGLSPDRPATLTFADVAVDGYQQVATVNLTFRQSAP